MGTSLGRAAARRNEGVLDGWSRPRSPSPTPFSSPMRLLAVLAIGSLCLAFSVRAPIGGPRAIASSLCVSRPGAPSLSRRLALIVLPKAPGRRPGPRSKVAGRAAHPPPALYYFRSAARSAPRIRAHRGGSIHGRELVIRELPSSPSPPPLTARCPQPASSRAPAPRAGRQASLRGHARPPRTRRARVRDKQVLAAHQDLRQADHACPGRALGSPPLPPGWPPGCGSKHACRPFQDHRAMQACASYFLPSTSRSTV